jgi:hypothetical protein
MDDGWQGKLARASVGPLVFIEDKDFLWHATTKRHGIHLAAAPRSERNYKSTFFFELVDPEFEFSISYTLFFKFRGDLYCHRRYF